MTEASETTTKAAAKATTPADVIEKLGYDPRKSAEGSVEIKLAHSMNDRNLFTRQEHAPGETIYLPLNVAQTFLSSGYAAVDLDDKQAIVDLLYPSKK